MAEQPEGPNPFRPAKLPTWPADGILPGSTEAVIGLTQAPRGAFGQLAEAYAPLIVDAVFTGPLLANKLAVVVPMTPELLAEAEELREAKAQMLRLLNGTATPEERAMAEARRAAWKADRERRHAEAVAEWQQVRERHADSPAVLAVLDIHRPDSDGGDASWRPSQLAA